MDGINVTKGLMGTKETIDIDLFRTYHRLTHTEARQLIADIMAALDEPAKVDMTTQAYQEFRPADDIIFTKEQYEVFLAMFRRAMREGVVK